MKKIKFKYFLDEDNKPYWIPIVIKNKDVLCAFLNGMYNVMEVFNIPKNEVDLMLGSERFNDILPNGKRISECSDKEIMEYLKELTDISETHVENNDTILKDYYLPAECTCGMFYGFKNEYEIPKKDLECDLCGKKIIHYTGKNDEEFLFDGSNRLELLKFDNKIVSKVENINTFNDNANDFDNDIDDFVNTIENNNKKLTDLTFELNKKISRIDVLKRLLSLKNISEKRISELTTEIKKLEQEIIIIKKEIDDIK